MRLQRILYPILEIMTYNLRQIILGNKHRYGEQPSGSTTPMYRIHIALGELREIEGV